MTEPFTPIRNDILDCLAKTRLASYETRVLFAILRKTYGYVDKNGERKRIDWISYSQFCELTLLPRSHVYRALQGLASMNMVKRTLANGKSYYAFNSHPETWKAKLPFKREEILKRDNYTCYYCHQKFDSIYLHVDHKIPLVRNGTNNPTNLVTACINCNSEKGNMTSQEYISFKKSGISVPVEAQEKTQIGTLLVPVEVKDGTSTGSSKEPLQVHTKENIKENITKDSPPSGLQQGNAKKPPQRPIVVTSHSSKEGLYPCTLDEIHKIASDLNIGIAAVQSKHDYILDMVEGGQFKERWGKTIYFTLRNWLRRDRDDGRIAPISWEEKQVLQYETPEYEKKYEQARKILREAGL